MFTLFHFSVTCVRFWQDKGQKEGIAKVVQHGRSFAHRRKKTNCRMYPAVQLMRIPGAGVALLHRVLQMVLFCLHVLEPNDAA